ncbi:MAG: NAD-dependent epimerase/dehydratase family protein [Deltaproteobacteria bacterium]|nr:NAD-dependent epimerase/dehydratase family protein [Deltaproteobacteria bacterium]
MKALLLGGSGFIGHHLTEALQAKGIEPLVVDMMPPAIQNIPFTTVDLCSLTDDNQVFKGIDVVYHLAWTTIPKTSGDNPEYDAASNIPMSIRILNACIKNNVKKIVFISSGGTVYGIPKTVPVAEGHPTDPICSYGITKLCVEKYLMMYNHLHGLDYVVIRPSNPFGEYQNPFGEQGAISVFLGHLIKRMPINIWGDGSVVRDFLYIGDLADAMVRILDYRPAATDERIFNVGSGMGYSLNDILDIIHRVTNIRQEVIYTEARRVDVPLNILDISLIREKIGWFPQFDMEDAVERTWKWLKDNIR